MGKLTICKAICRPSLGHLYNRNITSYYKLELEGVSVICCIYDLHSLTCKQACFKSEFVVMNDTAFILIDIEGKVTSVFTAKTLKDEIPMASQIF